MSAEKERAFTFIPLGAILKDFKVAGQNLVLNFSSPDEYLQNPCYFGATIGRVANRIDNASFTLNNGTKYQLAANNGPCALHGGVVGWDKRVWEHELGEEVKFDGEEGGNKVGGWRDIFGLVSEDGDEGYPGKVKCTVRYTQWRERWEGAEGGYRECLEMEFEVRMVEGEGEGEVGKQGEEVRETVVNVTNHTYFNLSGAPNISGHLLTLPSTTYLPVSPTGIPLTTSTSTPYPSLAPSTPFPLGPTEPDIDDCFLLNPHPHTIPFDTRPLPLQLCVAAYHPDSKIHLEVLTTEPAFQLYTGKYIDVETRIDGSGEKKPRAGFCVEPERYVDAVSRGEWKGMVLLERGGVYGARIVYRGWKATQGQQEQEQEPGVEAETGAVQVVQGEEVMEGKKDGEDGEGKGKKSAAVVVVDEGKPVRAKSKREKRLSMNAGKRGKCVIS